MENIQKKANRKNQIKKICRKQIEEIQIFLNWLINEVKGVEEKDTIIFSFLHFIDNKSFQLNQPNDVVT